MSRNRRRGRGDGREERRREKKSSVGRTGVMGGCIACRPLNDFHSSLRVSVEAPSRKGRAALITFSRENFLDVVHWAQEVSRHWNRGPWN